MEDDIIDSPVKKQSKSRYCHKSSACKVCSLPLGINIRPIDAETLLQCRRRSIPLVSPDSQATGARTASRRSQDAQEEVRVPF